MAQDRAMAIERGHRGVLKVKEGVSPGMNCCGRTSFVLRLNDGDSEGV